MADYKVEAFNKACQIWKDSKGKIPIRRLARKVGVTAGTIARWRDNGWVQKSKRLGGGVKGNQNAKGHGAPKGSQNGLKTGAYSKIDISNGVYVPMAGFGGIKHAAELWFQDNFVFPINGNWDHLIECYDINESFCNWYGWTQRDMLQQIIHTDKTCLVCPPFGKTYEHWKGTPDEMADIGFVEWYKLIKKHVIAPNYIIIGPEIGGKGYDNSNKKMCGLFNKTTGIQLWTDDMIYGNDVK